MQVGLVVMDENPADALKIVRAAERAGIHSLWTIDYYNRSSLTRAAAFAAVTETPIVGTSVTPLFARAPLALAAAAADIQGIAGGRFVLGVGSSTRRMNQDCATCRSARRSAARSASSRHCSITSPTSRCGRSRPT